MTALEFEGFKLILANEAQIAELEDMVASMYEHFFAANGLTKLPESGFKNWMAGYGRTRNVSRTIFICYDGSTCVGMIEGQIKIAGVMSGLGKIGNIAHLFILPQYRKRGLARKLYEIQTNWFLSKRVSNLTLEVVHGNEGALAFWESLGFKPSFINLVNQVGSPYNREDQSA